MAKQIISPKYEWVKEDFISIGKGALIAGGGAMITYLVPTVEAWITGHQAQLGEFAPLATVLFSIAINIVRKWLSQTKY